MKHKTPGDFDLLLLKGVLEMSITLTWYSLHMLKSRRLIMKSVFENFYFNLLHVQMFKRSFYFIIISLSKTMKIIMLYIHFMHSGGHISTYIRLTKYSFIDS